MIRSFLPVAIGFYKQDITAILWKKLWEQWNAWCRKGRRRSRRRMKILSCWMLAAEKDIMPRSFLTEAIKQAARSPQPVKWMVADITNIPMKDQSVDCILDVFTPANYKEFVRILKPGGVLVKVVPGASHMSQLRKAAAPLLRNKSYSNEEVLDYFEKNFEMVSRTPVSKTMEIGKEHLADLVRMTPLLFDVDKSRLDVSGIREITVEAEVLVGESR